MADLFALQGTSNSGKTQTLIHLFDSLVARYPEARVEVHHRRVEITVILHGVNGHCIGIESQGDPGSRLEASLKLFSSSCDIIFCACRMRGMTVNWVNAMAPRYRVHFVPKPQVSSGYAAANAAAAAGLMGMAGL